MDEGSGAQEEKQPGTLIVVIAGAAFALLLCLGAAAYFVFESLAPPGQRQGSAPVENQTAVAGGAGPIAKADQSAGPAAAPAVPAETVALPGPLPGGKMPPHSDKIIRRVSLTELSAIGDTYSGAMNEDLLWNEESRLLPRARVVAVTEGTGLKFRAEWDIRDISALGRLKPDDLDAVDLSKASLNADSLAPISNLTGLKALKLEGETMDDRAMARLRSLRSLNVLELRACPITDTGIETIAGLPRLRALILRGAQISGAGIKKLGRLKHLLALEIWETRLYDRDLASFSALPRLQYLTIVDTRITDEGLVWLKRMPSLQLLRISDARVRGSGFSQWRGVPLKALVLSDTYLDDAGAANLSGLKNLRRLSLADTRITDRSIALLVKLPSLVALDLAHTLVTDASAEQLAGAKSLKWLNLPAQISASARARLQKRLPRCRIAQADRWPFN